MSGTVGHVPGSPPSMSREPDGRPRALSALPSPLARAAALGAVLIAGLCGALIGYAFFDLQSDGTFWPVFGMLVCGVVIGGGVAVVAVLALRASSEWRDRLDPTESAPPTRLGQRSDERR
jgi:hypothetical protein